MANFTLTNRPSEKRSRLVDASPVYYGWIVVVAATIGMAMTIPAQTAGISLFIDQIIADLGLPRSSVAGSYTLATVAGASALSLIGRWIDRFGPRRAVVVIVVGLALACGVMSLASGLLTLFVGFTLLRAMGPGALSLVNLHVVNIWFVRKRGSAVGWMGIGLAGSMALYPLFVEHVLDGFGWRESFLIVGLIVLAVMAPLGWLFFREHPEKYGIVPDGQSASGEVRGEVSLTLADARRSPAFWMLTAGGVCIAAVSTGLMFHHFSIMDANGLNRAASAALFVPFGFVTAGSNVLTGFLVDRISPRILVGVMLGVFAVILTAIPLISNLTHVWMYGSFFGFGQGMMGALMGSGYAYYFGRLHIGAIKGFANTLFVGGSAGGPILYALGFDMLGSYGPMLYLTAALSGALALAAFLLTDRRLEPSTDEPAPNA